MINLDHFEQKFAFWLKQKRFKFVYIAIFSVFIYLIKDLPYLNLLLEPGVVFFAILTFSFFVLGVKEGLFIAVGLVFLVPALLLTWFGGYAQAEIFGNYTYGFLLVGMLKSILSKKDA